MAGKVQYKKYLLIKECLGTEPYVNSRYEMDIKDIIEYAVIPSKELHEHDVVKVVGESNNEEQLIEAMRELEEADWYMSMGY